MKLVLDVENTTTQRGGKNHMDPFEQGNKLVQVGMLDVQDANKETHIITLDHRDSKDTDATGSAFVQAMLNKTSLLIGHNLQHDLAWLWACGFTYDGNIYDTMLAEYLLLRGQKEPLSLAACAERRRLSVQKDDTLKRYFKEGYNTDEIPLQELCHYLRADLRTTGELYLSIERDFADSASASLEAVKASTFTATKTLTRMYMSGFAVDKDELDKVGREFEEEKAALEATLQKEVRSLMGDTPINLNSPEQMSHVIFSRRVKDKSTWEAQFDGVDTKKEFKDAVDANSILLKKTRCFTCPTCGGEGKVYKTKKDGSQYARPNKCKDCLARGYQLEELSERAGLGFAAPSAAWVTANGFGTGKDRLDSLIATARTNNMDTAVSFLSNLKRLSAVSSYLSSFVDGIRVFTKTDGFLHVGLTQHITATGRFSGRNPNMQNMPRGNTFPVKRVFVSRWEGGQVLEADFAQLEFRVAAFLAQDKVAMKEIETGFDVHSYTANVISDAGQATNRQEAKAHTFAPLFGATGYGRSRAEAAYYTHFVEKYKGIAAWHNELASEALRFNKVTNVSGRQYAFPHVMRRANGTPSHFTQIKNYPVQGFATGDIVPVVLTEFEKRIAGMQSCLVNTVHDSLVADVHPDETQGVIQVVENLNGNLNNIIQEAYGVEMNVPLLLEAKMGPNWLDTKDV